MVGHVLDAQELVNLLALRNARVVGDELIASCPITEEHRNGDAHPSFAINLESGLSNCFSCGFGGTLLQLVSKVLGVDQLEARRLLYRDLSPEDIDRLMNPARRDRIASKGSYDDNPYRPTPYEEAARRIVPVAQYHPYWQARGFSRDTVDRWLLGYDPSCNRAVVPVMSGGEMVGWQKRRVDDVAQGGEPKWLSAPNMNRNRLLFGLDMARKRGAETAILVEAPLSAVMLDQQGFHGGVASFGCQLSNDQALLLRENFSRVIVFYDPDDAGRRGTEKAVSKLDRFLDVLVVPPTRDDPAAMTAEENGAAVSGAVPSWLWQAGVVL